MLAPLSPVFTDLQEHSLRRLKMLHPGRQTSPGVGGLDQPILTTDQDKSGVITAANQDDDGSCHNSYCKLCSKTLSKKWGNGHDNHRTLLFLSCFLCS